MLIVPDISPIQASGQQAQLRILQTTDLHAHVFPYDYHQDHPMETLGLGRTAGLIVQARAEVANSILLDNGDLLQGSALGDYMAYDRGLRKGDLHPVIAAMNALDYDAATLGNHEFNFGLPFLMAAIGGAAFPFVSANALVKKGADARHDKRLLPPYVLLDRRIRDAQGRLVRVRIGVLGLLPPQIVTWDETLLKGRIESRDMVETAAALIPEMREAGADVVVVLAHTGIGAAQHCDGMENAALPLARLPGVDALIAGHTHMVFPSPQFADVPGVDLRRGRIGTTPTVMAGFFGSHLGVVDLVLERDGKRWRVVDSLAQARPIVAQGAARKPLVRSVPRVLRAARAGHRATLDYMNYPVGRTQAPLHSYFALVRNCAAVQLICQAQARFIAEARTGSTLARLPLLSAAAPFKVGGWGGSENYTDIPAGPLFQRNLADLYCFPNTICALHLRGADIVEWLERSAAAFHRVTPGLTDQPLLDDAFPSYNFDVITGLTYRIDPSQPARYCVAGRLIDGTARRVRDICHQGKPLDMQAEFLVATNNFRASTRAAFCVTPDVAVTCAASTTIRTILLNEVARRPGLDVTLAPNWSFVPMPDTSFIFTSSPKAARYLPDTCPTPIEQCGDDANGFSRYRLWGAPGP